MQIAVYPAAAADIDEAFAWYESKRTGLEEDFLAAARMALESISNDPTRHTGARDSVRVVLARQQRQVEARHPETGVADQQNSCVIRTLSSAVSAIPMPDLSWLRFKIFVR